MTGQELIALRLKQEWGINETAENLGVPKSTYKRWEQYGVPDNRLYQVQRGFGIKPTPPPQDYGYIDNVERDANGMPLKCKGCIYRHGYSSAGICNYGLMTGTPRYCSIEDCDRYKKGAYRGRDRLY